LVVEKIKIGIPLGVPIFWLGSIAFLPILFYNYMISQLLYVYECDVLQIENKIMKGCEELI